MDQTRIAFLYPSLDGAPYLHPVLAEFTEQHPNTTFFTARWPGYRKDFENAFHVSVVGKLVTPWVKPDVAAAGYLHLPMFRLAGQLLQFRPQVIFTDAFSTWSMLAVLMKPLLRWKIVILYDGSSPSVDARNNLIKTIWRRCVAGAADAFITNTKAGHDYLSDHLHVPCVLIQQDLYLVPAPELFRVQREKHQKERVCFVAVNRLVRWKGMMHLLKATVELQKYYSGQYMLSIIGDGEEKQVLQEYAAQHLDRCVEWHGNIPHHEVRERLREADVFVFPSFDDVLGVAPLEAMATGMPVICSKCAGAAELIEEGINGFVVDPNNIDDLATKMSWFIDHREQLDPMGKQARQTVTPYTPVQAAGMLHNTALRLFGLTESGNHVAGRA